MIILKPVATKYLNHRDLTEFYWEGKTSQEFFVRGAIAWPEGELEGFALFAAQFPHTKEIILLEEFPFWTVDVFQEGGVFKQAGLATFFGDVWSKYHCNVFYAYQHPDVHQRYAIQVYENKGIHPKPEIVQVPMVERLGDNLFHEYGTMGKLYGDHRMEMATVMKKHFAMGESPKKPHMAIHALRCLLAGLEYAGWIEPSQRVKEVIFFGTSSRR